MHSAPPVPSPRQTSGGASLRPGRWEAEDDPIVRYGATIRLYTVSAYTPGQKGGYVGYYRKSRARRAGPFVAIPPFDLSSEHMFKPACFQARVGLGA